MGPGFGAPRGYEYQKIPAPKSLREVPAYLKKLLGDFFCRLLYIFKLVWESGPWILFVLLFLSLLEGVLPLVGAYITKEVVNSLQEVLVGTLSDFKPVIYLLVFFFIYKILNTAVTRVNTMVTRIAGELVVNHIKIMIMEKSKEVDLASFDMPEFYEKLENANREAGNRPVSILSSTFNIVSTIVSIISYIIVLSVISPLATVAIIIISIPSAIINFIYRKKTFNYMRRKSKERRQMSYYSDLMVNKDLVKEVRIFGLSDLFIGKFKAVFKKYFAGIKALILGEGLWYIGLTVVASVVNALFFVFIAYKVFTGEIMIGDYTFYTSALTSIASGVSSLITITATIYEGTLFINNMISFMDEKPSIVPILPEPIKINAGAPHTFEFKDVSFRYPGTERYVLKNINLKFREGETVVLVGLNGAGKTTLIKLLTRLYDPTEGTIFLDGHDIREYDLRSLYDMYGIIFQDFGKYAVSVKENIAFGEIGKDANDENVTDAANKTGADDFIERLPKGYDTPLMRIFEDDGIELSIGQWQKLAIARAFYSDSDVLILDEPTASLDPMAEQEIFNQFDELRRDKTTIFVSHRLSSATVASKIVVLEYGEVIEEGTHKELMQKGGRYFELFTTQAKRYIDGGGDKPKIQ